MNTQLIIDYLSELSMNNNREWYHAHKEYYKNANAEFENLLQTLMLEIGKFDSSILQSAPKDLTFKLVRDTRFSHDKSPYNPAFIPRPYFFEREAAGSCRLLHYDKAGQSVLFGWRIVCRYV